MTWLGVTASGPTPLARVLGLRPELRDGVDALFAALWDAVDDPVTVELCRLRLAQLHQCDAELALRTDVAVAAGLTEAAVDELARWPSSAAFTPHQRACLAFAEQFAIDVHGLGDEQAATVAAGFGPAGFVAFVMALGLYDGLIGLRRTLAVDGAVE